MNCGFRNLLDIAFRKLVDIYESRVQIKKSTTRD